MKAYNVLGNVEILEINFGSTDWTLFHTGWKAEEKKSLFDAKKKRKLSKRKARKIQEDRENYTNFKSKMFDLLAIDIKNSIKLLRDNIYKKQLPTIRIVPDGKGRLKVESKEDYKARTGETSPDESDSIALANFARYFAITPISIGEAFNIAMNKGAKKKVQHAPIWSSDGLKNAMDKIENRENNRSKARLEV
jgi:hypothetical protein